MFQKLGKVVARCSPFIVIGWVLLVVTLKSVAPEWEQIVGDGQFSYLPSDVPSRAGEDLFKSAFSKDLLGSSVVLVARRESGDEGLTDVDRSFIEDVLMRRLEEIAEEEGGLAGSSDDEEIEDEPSSPSESTDADESDDSKQPPKKKSIISKIRTFNDPAIGGLLKSEDNKSILVIIELTTEFMQYSNRPTIEKIEALIENLRNESHEDARTPPGLDLALSGSATVGRDMRVAAKQSASATETWTILLVVILLILIYRAPVLALIPLITVYMSVSIAIKSLSLMASAGFVGLFTGIEVYVTVVLYGAGVDYCMFLMARYKEELNAGATYDEAIANAVSKVGAALAASAGTTMCGIGMMVFAQFGKFREAGVAMSLSLFFVLCASLTFAPALLRLSGRWAFWPNMRSERISATSGWVSPTHMMARIMGSNWFRGVWERIGQALLEKPGTIWLTCVAFMSPFAIYGVMNFSFMSYGLLSELPKDDPSVVGTKAVQEHFPAGATGPVTVLLTNLNVDFSSSQGIEAIEEFSERLMEVNQSKALGIADIRSVAKPLGVTNTNTDDESNQTLFQRRFTQRMKRKRAIDFYVSDQGEFENHVTRIDVVFEDDPFSPNSIQQFDVFQSETKAALPDELTEATKLAYIGSTPSIRDLKTVTASDRVVIDILVIVSVFLILVLLLKRPAISAYLILSVFFSYLVTLGVTFVVYSLAAEPGEFAGLDWKVPMFLFTILIVVGEDYNIYLITRIDEEQKKHGAVKGITVALSKTGSIISSCGLIMAGTFASLMAGSLVGVHQLGFALAFGVMIDTFVVRPILVPAYLIMLNRGKFGGLGKLLGAYGHVAQETHSPLKVGSEGSNV